jgi:FAD:protein FMN transferase
MNGFRSMGCDVLLPFGAPVDEVRALFDERDLRFSRFIPSSELNRVNAAPLGVTVVSEDLASMLALALDAARATGGVVTPTVGGAVIAAGYDRDFSLLDPDGDAVEPARVPSADAVLLRGRILIRADPVMLDLNGVVKSKTVDDALALIGHGWVAAGGDVATTQPIVVGLPAGGAATLDRGGLATSSVARRSWRRGGAVQHHLIDPASGAPARTPWRDVSVAAASCVVADVAAKAALLLGEAGPSWLDRRGLPGRFVDHAGAVQLNETWRSQTPAEAAA